MTRPLSDAELDAALAAYAVPALADTFTDRVVAQATRPDRVRTRPAPRVGTAARRPWLRRPIVAAIIAVNLVAASAVAAVVSGHPVVFEKIAAVAQHLFHPHAGAPAARPRHHVAPVHHASPASGEAHAFPGQRAMAPPLTPPQAMPRPSAMPMPGAMRPRAMLPPGERRLLRAQRRAERLAAGSRPLRQQWRAEHRAERLAARRLARRQFGPDPRLERRAERLGQRRDGLAGDRLDRHDRLDRGVNGPGNDRPAGWRDRPSGPGSDAPRTEGPRDTLDTPGNDLRNDRRIDNPRADAARNDGQRGNPARDNPDRAPGWRARWRDRMPGTRNPEARPPRERRFGGMRGGFGRGQRRF